MREHTPGPWEQRGKGPGDYHLVGANGIIVCDPYEPNPQDARLIAAAPELLEALEGALADPYDNKPETWDKVRNAIAKAKGEQ